MPCHVQAASRLRCPPGTPVRFRRLLERKPWISSQLLATRAPGGGPAADSRVFQPGRVRRAASGLFPPLMDKPVRRRDRPNPPRLFSAQCGRLSATHATKCAPRPHRARPRQCADASVPARALHRPSSFRHREKTPASRAVPSAECARRRCRIWRQPCHGELARGHRRRQARPPIRHLDAPNVKADAPEHSRIGENQRPRL